MKDKIISIFIICLIIGCAITTIYAASSEETTANQILNQKIVMTAKY